MALSQRSRSGIWSRLHFLVRFAGLTGLLAGGAGLMVTLLQPDLSWWNALRSLPTQPPEDPLTRTGLYLLAGGAGAALLALLVELLAGARLVAGRRSAFGMNVGVQLALAIILVVGVNYYSFLHYQRNDWTRKQQFTLPPEIRSQLSQLRDETTIVVYQRHKTFGQLSEKPDAYDYAAERKVVEKIQDLVEQFREFGPQFRVVVLDVEEEGFNDKLDALAKDSRELRAAVDDAPENSIFFLAGGKVQRLSFNDFYRLDKTGSQEAEAGRGNLVLLNQGIEPFARKVLNIDEKRPRIAVGVVHEVLGLEGSEELGMGGVRKVLSSRGFDTRDLILKKWSEFGPPEAAVLTYDESKLERLEELIAELRANTKTRDEELEALQKHVKEWQTASLDDLSKTELAKDLGVRRVSESIRLQVMKKILEPNVALRQFLSEQEGKELAGLLKERAGLEKVEESLAEQRRLRDLKSKTERLLADCDLLVLPRMTLFNVARGDRISNWVYRLDQAQVDAIKGFLKAGKPVLACLGPSNEPQSGRPDPLDAGGPDGVEDLLARLGIRLAKQTVLFNVETKSFAERRSGLLIAGANVEVPPVKLDWEPGAGRLASQVVSDEPLPPNPVRKSLRLTVRSLGKSEALALRVRHPRPIYVDPSEGAKLAFAPEFMLTDRESWNEDQPFPTRERTPRYEPPKGDETGKDPWEKKRLGPFPIGVAVEATLPADWYDDKSSKPGKVRLAVIGHGGLFIGPELSPAKEQLLLHTCNWLLGRDDLLPKTDREWSFPRVKLDTRTQDIWHWGAWLGLPGLFAYLGLVVLMVRRLR